MKQTRQAVLTGPERRFLCNSYKYIFVYTRGIRIYTSQVEVEKNKKTNTNLIAAEPRISFLGLTT